MRVLLMLSLLAASLASVDRADAQSSKALVGSWERFSVKDSTGADVQPQPAAAFTIFGADGYYSQLTVPTGRPKVSKPLSEYTKEELLDRYRGTEGRRGRYSVSGDVLTRTFIATLNPNDEGREPQVQRFRIEGDVLILSSTVAGNRAEARFRRAK